jgi:hypothetical protein
LNAEFRAVVDQHKKRHSQTTAKIALLLLGNPAPGGNNIVDGLLKY